MFGAPSLRRFGSTRFLYVDVSIVSPALEADGVGGNGRISCADAAEKDSAQNSALMDDQVDLSFIPCTPMRQSVFVSGCCAKEPIVTSSRTRSRRPCP